MNTTSTRNGFAREAEGVSEIARETASNLASEFKNLVADIEDFITSSTTLTGEQLEEARERVRDRVAAAKETVEAAGETTLARARRSAEYANEYVHDQPWIAVGVSVAVGFLTGFVCGRRD